MVIELAIKHAEVVIAKITSLDTQVFFCCFSDSNSQPIGFEYGTPFDNNEFRLR